MINKLFFVRTIKKQLDVLMKMMNKSKSKSHFYCKFEKMLKIYMRF